MIIVDDMHVDSYGQCPLTASPVCGHSLVGGGHCSGDWSLTPLMIVIVILLLCTQLSPVTEPDLGGWGEQSWSQGF